MSESLMRMEARQTPDRIEKQLSANTTRLTEIHAQIAAFAPLSVMIIGRGSSDHAGVYAKYLIETELGLPVASAAPSVCTLFGRALKLQKTLVICISQSGRSPDILKQLELAKTSGALCLAIVNDEDSPLANLAQLVLPLHAGKERAVAATKSYLCTLSAIIALVATWSQSQDLLKGLSKLPQCMRQTIQGSAQLLSQQLSQVSHCMVLGRGFGYAISREIALKFKEVCGIHAEAYSSAEFLHGPVTLVAQKMVLINVEIEDETSSAHQAHVEEVKSQGGEVINLISSNASHDLHPRLQALLVMQRFYLDIEAIALSFGFNPDAPVGLRKVTKTL
ncbi:glucosamine-6-phosphate deaminase NagB-II [Ningiella sp. W23]|uniref:glucosamine-6-phosphate deaminase NagB-II n=1 Tax=Ningiella sp. W23 TaxID=3023715 RepID=UPI0037563401